LAVGLVFGFGEGLDEMRQGEVGEGEGGDQEQWDGVGVGRFDVDEVDTDGCCCRRRSCCCLTRKRRRR